MSESSQSKTENASPKKREEARQQGQVATSQDFATAITLLLTLFLLSMVGSDLGGDLLAMITLDLSSATSTTELSIEQTSQIAWRSCVFGVQTLLALLLGSSLVAFGSHVIQVGFQVTPKAIEWKPSRLSPASGAKRIFSARGGMRTLMALGKFLAVVAAMAATCFANIDEMTRVEGASDHAISTAWKWGIFTAMMGALGFLAVSLCDLAFQRWQLENDLKMSLEEVKRETKENEGDAQIRGRLKKARSEAVQRRSLGDVPAATVVITNPTHFAVALQYNQGSSEAPKVLAKGTGAMAQRIKKIARDAGVPTVENKPVARALYANAEIGDEIPGALYRAVAEILVQVYRLRR